MLFNFFIMAALKAPKGSGMAAKLMPLANKLIEFALPAAIVVSIWGLIQMILGDPSGKERIKNALIGFIGLFVIPTIFFAIWDTFN